MKTQLASDFAPVALTATRRNSAPTITATASVPHVVIGSPDPPQAALPHDGAATTCQTVAPVATRQAEIDAHEYEPAFLVQAQEENQATEENKLVATAEEEIQECALVVPGEEEDEDGFVLIGDEFVGEALSGSYDIVGGNGKAAQ